MKGNFDGGVEGHVNGCVEGNVYGGTHPTLPCSHRIGKA